MEEPDVGICIQAVVLQRREAMEIGWCPGQLPGWR